MSSALDNYDPRGKITKIETDLYQPDKFAALFCEAAGKQKDIDRTIKEILKDVINSDLEVKNIIRSCFEDFHKQNVWALFSKLGFFIWSICLAVISGLAGYFLKS